MSLIWINGQLVDKSEAKISVFDHGFLYGDGVWEHFRAFNGKLFRPEQQIEFFFDSLLRLVNIDSPLSPAELVVAIESTLAANHRNEGYIRVVVSRGPGTLGPDPRKIDPLAVIIAEEYQPYPLDLYEHGLHATKSSGFYPDNPEHYSQLLGAFYLVRAKQCALAAGCLEAVVFWGNEVLRGIEGNLFLVRNGRVYPIDRGGYDVLLDVIPEIAIALTIPVERRFEQLSANYNMQSLLSSDEVFLAGITCGVIAIISVDKTPIGTGCEGPITKRIREAYRKLTRGDA